MKVKEHLSLKELGHDSNRDRPAHLIPSEAWLNHPVKARCGWVYDGSFVDEDVNGLCVVCLSLNPPGRGWSKRIP